MKIYKYIFNMNRIFGLLLVGFMLAALHVNAVKAEGKMEVRGIVRDANTQKPIMAAQISIINNKQTTTTDENGHFKIVLPARNLSLTVSAYDYNVREFPVQGSDSVIINLYPDVFGNYYKKVNGISGASDNSMLTTAVKGISDLSQSQAYTANEALQTEFGGNVRSISRSALSGIGSSLFIRGLNSINANAQPLFVVDGVIWNSVYDQQSIHQGYYANPLNNIDMNDIESVTVMKNGTSVYGSKASNGVVLIKTKRATGMATKINLNIVTGITTAPTSLPVMNSAGYKTYVTDILGSAGLSNVEIENLPYLSDNPKRTTYRMYHNNTNWADELYQNAVTKNYSINVNGGDEKAMYYFSLGYTGNNGVVKTTDQERYNMRLNGDINITNYIKLGLNAGFARTVRTLVDDGVNNYTSPAWMGLIKSPFLSPNTFTFTGERTTEYSGANVFDIGNPGAVLKYSNNTVKQDYFNFSVKPEIKITPNLKFTENFDYTLNKSNEDYYRPYFYTAPVMVDGVGYSYNARESQVARNNAVFSDARLSYEKKIGAFSKLNAIIGSRYVINKFISDYVEGHNSKSNVSINLPGSFSDLYTTGLYNYTKSISNYINVDYNYGNRFLVNATAAMDASSRFGNETASGFNLFGHKWGVFPSINGAWLLTSEDFMKSVPFVNLLKIRAGYGITGNDDVKDYQTQAYFSAIRFTGVANGMILSSLANPTIQWETTRRANLGVDLNLLNERLALSVNVYSSVTDHLLVLKNFQDAVGLGAYWTNEGKMSNKGIEAGLNARLINLKNFHWELGLSAGHYVNKILSLPNGSFTTNVYDGQVLTAVGNAAGLFYGFKTNGVYANEKAAVNANLKILNDNGVYSNFGAGNVIFVDRPDANGNTNGIIDDNDKQVIGNPNPTVYGSISNKFSYKNFTLSAWFTYSYGNQVYNYLRSQLEASKDYSNQSTAVLARWTSENQITTQPKAVFGDPMGNARFSDRWIEDGSYLRLKTLMLSYNLSVKSNFLEGVNIWISANNVFTLTKYLGVDPEFSTSNAVLFQGVDAGLLPFSRSYNIGLKFSL
ncbi:MAG: SusC/RagA family TonB-linked outer membrane protein [Paludibacter sp.]